MEANEKHNKGEIREENADLIEKGLKARGRERHENNTRKINKLWLWFGVIILIFILLYWLWTIGLFEDVVGLSNG